MAELRVGGLAIIINSRVPENIGITVRLVKHVGVVMGYMMPAAYDAWEIESASGRKLSGYLADGKLVSGPASTCPSKWLMPIDGDDFSHEREREKELING
ncbi:MAG: hypothetical protein E7L09_05770 [Enterobacteriaceae bacterium]|nr:hypothetical protein [Enterobacteriaceae bacterium]